MSRVTARGSRRGHYHGVPMDDMSEELNAQSFPDSPSDSEENARNSTNSASQNAGLSEQPNLNSANQSLEYISFPSADIESRRSVLQRLLTRNMRLSCSKRCQFVLGVVLAIVLMLLIPGICTGLGYYSVFVKKPEPVIDKSYHSFSIPNHPVSLHYKAFKTASSTAASSETSFYYALNRARSHRGNNGSPQNSYFSFKHEKQRNGKELRYVKGEKPKHSVVRRSSGEYPFYTIDSEYQYHLEWKLQVVFIAKDGSKNIFTKEKLDHIHNIEQKIINFPHFKKFCYKDIFLNDPAVKSINGCAPLNSLLSYFYPSVVDGKTYYDGLGMTLTSDINETLKLALSSDHLYYFVDEKMDTNHRQSRLLRTEVFFGSPLKGYMYPSDKTKEQTQKFKDFVIQYIDLLSESSTNEVQVLYGGNEIFDYEVETTFWQDVSMAYYAGGAIFLFMLIFTSFSLWLTFWGLVAITSCFPLAFFLYRVIFNIRALGILNGVAAFVIIGIGVDDVFVFINIFRQASHVRCRRARLLHTVRTAGKATFFTSFTTAAAFAANMTSSIPAVHAFGLFMSLIVACCWVTVVLIMPPALYIWSLSFYHCEKFIAKRLCKFSSKLTRLPDNVAQFVHGNHTPEPDAVALVTPPPQVIPNDDDDDLPLLTLDDPMEYYISTYANEDVDDEPLLDSTPHHQVAALAETDSFVGGVLQAALYYWVARPVIKGRKIILVLSLVILGVSIGLSTQLKPAAKSPRIFRENTNLQMLLDLKESLGIDTMSCSRCSAIYHLNEQTDRPYKPAHKQNTYHPQQPPKPVIPPNEPTNIPLPSPLPPWISPMRTLVTAAPHLTKPATVKPTPLKHKATTTSPERRKTTPEPVPTPKATLKKNSDQEDHNNEGPPTKKAVIASPTTMTPKPATPRTLAPPTAAPPTPAPPTAAPKLAPSGCEVEDCDHPKDRPMIETGAAVYVVFGIDRIEMSNKDEGHVVDDSEGIVQYDSRFSKSFQFTDPKTLMAGLAKLCRVCARIAARTDLVKNGTAHCFPNHVFQLMKSTLNVDPPAECTSLPSPAETVFGRKQAAHFIGGMDKNTTGLHWWAFGFESTSKKTQSYFTAYRDFLEWEKLITEIKETILKDSPELMSVYQTSEFWTKVMMEVVAVSSAIYGLVLSMLICVVAVAIFTGHAVLLFIVFFTIAEMIVLVVGIFYLAGWRMGGVEAISLSILVGSSVDYCVHLVEGYLLAGKAIPSSIKQEKPLTRQWRTKAALCHIGVSIFSSAVTTIVAAIPLTQTIIQPFSKFGQIVAINTTVSILYTLTVCTALLGTLAPPSFVLKWKSVGKATLGTLIAVGLFVLCLFILSKCGVVIPDPNGNALF